MDQYVHGILEQAFVEEDKPVIEASFHNLDGADFWDQPPVSLGIDTGGVFARRKIKSMLQAEQGAS